MRIRAWLRPALGVAVLPILAFCSSSDPEMDARLAAVDKMVLSQQWDEAIEAARQLLSDDPDDARARAKLGWALLGKSRITEEIVDMAALDEAKAAGDPEAFFDPKLFRTEVSYDEMLREEARLEFESVLAADDSILEAYTGLATLYAENGDYDASREWIGAAAAKFSGDADVLERLLPLGEAHFQEGRHQEALLIFEVLETSFDPHPTLGLDLGRTMFAFGRYDEGLAALRKASGQFPEDGTLLRALGHLELFRLQWPQAASAFTRLSELEPDDSFAHVLLGAALMPMDTAQAALAFEEAISPGSESRDPVAFVASNLRVIMTSPEVFTDDLVLLAHQLNRDSYPQIAAAVCGLMLRRDPESIPGRVMLASVYDTMRYFDLALAELDEVSEILTGYPEGSAPFSAADLSSHYGRVHFRMGNYAEAIEALEATEDPGRFTFTLALSHENLGDYQKAYELFRRVVEREGAPVAQTDRARQHLEKDLYAPFRLAP